jgi:Tfp pilus assembly protein FimT
MVYVWVVLAVLAVIAVAVFLERRRRSRLALDRARAGELRETAEARTADVATARHEVQVASADAETAHREAERADARLGAAERDLAHAEAEQEGLLREADRIDPSGRPSDALENPAPGEGTHRKEV